MKILHDQGFSEEEIAQQKSVVYSNTTQNMAVILKAMNTLNVPFDDAEREVSGASLSRAFASEQWKSFIASWT